jgi:dolichol-phosphate mannosyltransferase
LPTTDRDFTAEKAPYLAMSYKPKVVWKTPWMACHQGHTAIECRWPQVARESKVDSACRAGRLVSRRRIIVVLLVLPGWRQERVTRMSPTKREATSDPGVAILLPVLNEVANIDQLLSRIDQSVPDWRYSICVVDDGSTDGTVQRVQQRMDDLKQRVHLIQRVKTARGSQRGGALLAALTWALDNTDHHIIVEMDGDLSHRPEEMPIGIRLVAEDQCDVAIASKYVPGALVRDRPFIRRVLSRVCGLAVRSLISRRIRDYSNGYRFYSRRAGRLLVEYKMKYTSPIYLTEALSLWLYHDLRLVEFPATYVGRGRGESKLRFVDLGKAALASFEIAGRYHLTGFKPRAVESATVVSPGG